MGISIELYRIRIGHFEANSRRKIKCNKLGVKYSKIQGSTVFIFSSLILQLCSSCCQSQIEFIRTTSSANIKNREISDEKI